MRKTMFILALTTLTVMASATDAFAQRRGGGGGGGGGRRSGVSVSVNSGYRGGNYGGYRGGYYGGGYYGSGYRGYSTPYYGQSYYTPYYSNSVVVVPSEVRQSYYSTPARSQQETGMVRVLVPVANAQVWFDNSATNQRGMERLYHSPPLDPNGTFSYTVRASWLENGQTVNREQRVNVQPGQTNTVDFRASTTETLPLPK